MKTITFLLFSFVISVSSKAQSNNSNMEYPFIVLPDAKLYFSDKPFGNSNAGSKTAFTSHEFIYGRLELGSKTLSEAFKLTLQPAKGFHYLNYGILIPPKGKSEQELNYGQTIKYTLTAGLRDGRSTGIISICRCPSG